MPRSIRLSQRPAFCLKNPSFLVVSTYQLESADSRAGSLHFLSSTLDPIHTVATPAGVFRFLFPKPDLCVAALTDGSIYSTLLSDFTSSSVPVSSDMLLDVSCRDHLSLATDNKGMAHLVDMDTAAVVNSWLAHKLPYTGEPCEVWTCDFSPYGACTGGEDALLRLWDARTATSIGMSKVFEAGVTYTKWMDEHTLLTGSYDQKIRILDTRNMKQATQEFETAGGVWHIEKSEYDGVIRYLAACMYGGWILYDANFKELARDESAGKELLYGASLLSSKSLAYTTFNDYTVTLSDIDCNLQ